MTQQGYCDECNQHTTDLQDWQSPVQKHWYVLCPQCKGNMEID